MREEDILTFGQSRGVLRLIHEDMKQLEYIETMRDVYNALLEQAVEVI